MADSLVQRLEQLEQSIEAAAQAKARSDKELMGKVAAAEGKAQETAQKVMQAAKEKKDLEARHLKDLEDQVTKQKAELERREAVKQQEVQRLQAARPETVGRWRNPPWRSYAPVTKL